LNEEIVFGDCNKLIHVTMKKRRSGREYFEIVVRRRRRRIIRQVSCSFNNIFGVV